MQRPLAGLFSNVINNPEQIQDIYLIPQTDDTANSQITNQLHAYLQQRKLTSSVSERIYQFLETALFMMS